MTQDRRIDDFLDAALGPDSRAAAAYAWRGALASSVVYYGQGSHCGAEGVAALGRRFCRAHGWRDGLGGRRPGRPGGRGTQSGWAAARRAVRNASEAGELVLRGLLCLVAENGFGFRLEPSAVADLERAARLAPGSSWTSMALGLARYLERRWAEAAECFDRAAALRPGWNWPELLAADSVYFNARTEEARERFDKAVRLDPRCAWGWMLLSRVEYLQGDPKMLPDIRKAVRLEPRSGWMRAWRAAARWILGDRAGAERDAREAIRLDPSYDRAHAWFGQFLSGSRPREALSRLARAEKLMPYYEVIYYYEARARKRLGDWDGVVRALDKAIGVNRRTTWEFGWSDVLHADKAVERSLADLEEALARAPWAAGLAWRGQTLLLLRRYRDALASLDEAVDAGAEGPWPWVWKGEALRRLGHWRRARACFTRAAQADPGCAWAWAGRGACSLYLGRWAEAEAQLDRAIGLARSTGRGLPFLWRGEARLRLGRGDEARRDVETALLFYPHWRHWTKRLFEPGPAPARLPEPARAAPADPFDGPGQLAWARRLELDGRWAEASDAASRVLEECLDPLCGEALELRARARAALGRGAEAADDRMRLRSFSAAAEAA